MMTVLYWILAMAIGALVILLVDLVISKIKEKRAYKKYCDGKHYCNFCKRAYMLDDDESYLFCPFCGEELDYFDLKKAFEDNDVN